MSSKRQWKMSADGACRRAGPRWTDPDRGFNASSNDEESNDPTVTSAKVQSNRTGPEVVALSSRSDAEIIVPKADAHSSTQPKCSICFQMRPHPFFSVKVAPFSHSSMTELLGLLLEECIVCQSCNELLQRLDYHQMMANCIRNCIKMCMGRQPNGISEGSGESALSCSLCSVKAAGSQLLSRHLASHLQGSKLPCAACGRQFSGWQTLRRHALTVHQGAPLSCCHSCPAAFNTSTNLVAHKLIEHGATESLRQHSCPACGRRFSKAHRFVTHLQSHDDEMKPEVRRTLAALVRRHRARQAATELESVSLEESGGERQPAADASSLPAESDPGSDEMRDRDVRTDGVDDSELTGDEMETESTEGTRNRMNSLAANNPEGSVKSKQAPHRQLDGSFRCEKCEKVFKRKQSLQRHMGAVHKPSANLKCEFCDKTFSIKFYWQKHMNRHRDKSVQCPSCQRNFVNARALSRHKCLGADCTLVAADDENTVTSSAESPGSCRFRQRCPERHLGSNELRRPFTCDCGSAFTSRQARDAHAAPHLGQHQLICETCGAAFVTLTRLTTHRRMHQSEQKRVCRLCDAMVPSGVALRKHAVQHRERNFQCTVCGKCFRWKNNLDVHARIHADERPYQCDVCGHATRCSANLRLHKQRVHSSERPHSCTTCHKAFKERYNLVIHMRSHTGERPYVCECCGSGFTTKGKLNSHMSKHTDHRPHTCPLCMKTLKTQAIVSKHCRKVHGVSLEEAMARAGRRRHTVPTAAAPLLPFTLASNWPVTSI